VNLQNAPNILLLDLYFVGKLCDSVSGHAGADPELDFKEESHSYCPFHVLKLELDTSLIHSLLQLGYLIFIYGVISLIQSFNTKLSYSKTMI